MNNLFICVVSLFITSCVKKSSDSLSVITPDATRPLYTTEKSPVFKTNNGPDQFSKSLRESIYFASGLESEALRLINQNSSMQKLTLFSVINYIIEIKSGIKKAAPVGLDCSSFDVVREQNVIKIYKSCYKPKNEIANIIVNKEGRDYEIIFKIKEWSDVVGSTVGITGADVKCQFEINEKKLNKLVCLNWSYQTFKNDLSSTVLKASEFIFWRNGEKQFAIKGGFFKDLVENKKFDMIVPVEGKIKILEKEIEVIDDFIEKKQEVKSEEKEGRENKTSGKVEPWQEEVEFKKESNASTEASSQDSSSEEKSIQIGEPQNRSR